MIGLVHESPKMYVEFCLNRLVRLKFVKNLYLSLNNDVEQRFIKIIGFLWQDCNISSHEFMNFIKKIDSSNDVYFQDVMNLQIAQTDKNEKYIKELVQAYKIYKDS